MDQSWKLPGTKCGVVMGIIWQLHGQVKTIF